MRIIKLSGIHRSPYIVLLLSIYIQCNANARLVMVPGTVRVPLYGCTSMHTWWYVFHRTWWPTRSRMFILRMGMLWALVLGVACSVVQESAPSMAEYAARVSSSTSDELVFDEVSPLEVDASDRCAVCRLMYSRVLRRLGTAQRTEDRVTDAVEAACDDLRKPDANTSQAGGRKLMHVADNCDALVDAHLDKIEAAIMRGEQAHHACGRLVRVCYAREEL